MSPRKVYRPNHHLIAPTCRRYLCVYKVKDEVIILSEYCPKGDPLLTRKTTFPCCDEKQNNVFFHSLRLPLLLILMCKPGLDRK